MRGCTGGGRGSPRSFVWSSSTSRSCCGSGPNASRSSTARGAKKRRGTASWARLVAKVFHTDPLTCRKCGAKLKIVAYLHDTVAIKQILEHLGLSPPEEPKPPPAAHKVVRVPVDEEGREIEAP